MHRESGRVDALGQPLDVVPLEGRVCFASRSELRFHSKVEFNGVGLEPGPTPTRQCRWFRDFD